MAAGDIPPAVRALLREHVESHEHLEVLLLLCSRRERVFVADEVAAELGIGSAAAGAALEHLRAHGLLAGQEPGFRYSPRTAALDEAVSALASACREHRPAVMELMTTHAIDRLRTSALRTFADAFRLRKRKPDG